MGDDGRQILLVDNYDSYTYNLYHLIGHASGQTPIVVRNDDLWSVNEIGAHFSHVVISPGPGAPSDPARIGGCSELIARAPVPLLGVCLGHQAIAVGFGGTVEPVGPRHGRVSRVRHDNRGVLHGLPQHFRAVRYHSLGVRNLTGDLEVAAIADDDVVMALRHRSLPLHGVQFHPESVCADHGVLIMRNFVEVSSPPSRRPSVTAQASPLQPGPSARQATNNHANLIVREAPWRDPEDVFVDLYADRPTACWLDSRGPVCEQARLSFMGAPEGPRSHVVSYWLTDGTVRVSDGTREHVRSTTEPDKDIFGFLQRRIAQAPVPPPSNKFSFTGGYIGYLGYELKERCEGSRAHESDCPDAVFARIERFLAFDHETHQLYVVALVAPGEETEAQSWVERMIGAIRNTAPPMTPVRHGRCSAVTPSMDRKAYGEAFEVIQKYLTSGDTYETNLTFQLSFECTAEHSELYRHLRRANPAPFGAFLRFPDVTVLSTSPERFVRIEPSGAVESRPIKGTVARDPDPRIDAAQRQSLAKDEKTFAENLMITDLLRNDLGRVCRLGSVTVPDLMAIESYATVHQLVTTVRGRLEPDVDTVSCVRAIFPGGSMTGAPKIRTMEIIDEVEQGARGVYSGALGYFSLSGHIDLSIVIRSIIARHSRMTIGIGGAVTAMSNCEEEYAEAVLKGSALLTAVDNACGEEAQESIGNSRHGGNDKQDVLNAIKQPRPRHQPE